MLKEIFDAIESAGGECYFVGGFVRDFLLKIPSKDIDIEVFRLSYQQLSEILAKFGKVDLVGKSFGVIKVTVGERDFDFSLPRRESKNGVGHAGFDIFIDENITLEEAAGRRDFTMNSISMDKNGKIYDFYSGRLHLEAKLLTPTTMAFKDDALRVLRGFQFSARFDMNPNVGLYLDAHEMKKEYHTLPKERVWEEWKKWAAKGVHYTTSLRYLKNVGWVSLYPELCDILEVPQDKEWHPEGNVWTHTGFVLDAMAEIVNRENIKGDDRLVLIFAALCHDFGKATHTSVEENGRITSKGHEAASGPLARSFLESIGCPPGIIERVIPLVINHMIHQKLSDNAIRRLSNRLGKATIRELLFLVEADCSGRPPLPKGLRENGLNVLDRARELGILDSKPEPIVRGADIVEFGFKPGPIVGKIQKKLYEMQLNGKFDSKEHGLKLIKSFVKGM